MIERIKQISILEWTLFELIFFIPFWLINPYIAKLLSITLAPIFFGILMVSLIADKFDRSRISSKYYWVIFIFSIIPVILFFFFNNILQVQYPE